MKSIISMLATAAVLLSALTACGTNGRTRTDMANARQTPAPAVTAAPSARPSDLGDAVGEAARDAGNAVGGMAEDAGEAVDNAARRTGDAVKDLFDGTGTPRPTTGRGS